MPGIEQQSAARQIGEEWGIVVLDDEGKVQRLTSIRARTREGMDKQVEDLGTTPVNVRFAVAHITLHELPKPARPSIEPNVAAAGAFANLARTVTR